MAKKSLNGVLRHIRQLAAVQTSRAESDRQLLERFIAANDESAFTVLVERHGPMVQGVCRRALANVHDAEDACQATFLVLARKAGSIRKKRSISSWLHGVACRVAANLKREQARRVRRERSVPKPEVVDDGAEVTWREVQAVLDEELEQLPERYRTPLILCYLDGKTRDEAAKQLGLSLGRLHGRLERGRNVLRDRLTRRGLTLSAALFATALSAGVSQAAVSPTVVLSSTKAALALAGGQPLAASLVSANVLSLTREVLKTMFLTKLKLGTALVLCAGLLVTLIGGTLTSTSLAQDTQSPIDHLIAATWQKKTDSDEDFIRRTSLDLRGTLPTPTEVHFFVTSKDAGKRQKLIDLFVQERQAKQQAEKQHERLRAYRALAGQANALLLAEKIATPRFATIQADFYKQMLTATKDKKDVAAIAQNYLDRLMRYLKEHPKNDDVPDAMLQIVLVYGSQGKTVEAEAWRAKLLKEHPKSNAARTARETQTSARDLTWRLWAVPDVEYLDVEYLEYHGVLPKEEKAKKK